MIAGDLASPATIAHTLQSPEAQRCLLPAAEIELDVKALEVGIKEMLVCECTGEEQVNMTRRRSTLPLSCASTAFVAKTVPFLAALQVLLEKVADCTQEIVVTPPGHTSLLKHPMLIHRSHPSF